MWYDFVDSTGFLFDHNNFIELKGKSGDYIITVSIGDEQINAYFTQNVLKGPTSPLTKLVKDVGFSADSTLRSFRAKQTDEQLDSDVYNSSKVLTGYKTQITYQIDNDNPEQSVFFSLEKDLAGTE